MVFPWLECCCNPPSQRLNANETHIWDYKLGEMVPDWQLSTLECWPQATGPFKNKQTHAHTRPPEGHWANVQFRPWPSHALTNFSLNSRPCVMLWIRVTMNHWRLLKCVWVSVYRVSVFAYCYCYYILFGNFNWSQWHLWPARTLHVR